MRVYGIIVTYEPALDMLLSLCYQLKKQDVCPIIVDNSEEPFSFDEKVISLAEKVISFGENQGIAHAQNVGITYAISKNADIIVFFDQDSEIDKNFISNLLKPVIKGKPMIVAPIFYDSKNKFEYPSFICNRLGFLKPVFGNGKTALYPVDVIISSGCAVTSTVFQIAGMMDEDFFIDFVDIEWALRCRKKNIPIYIIPNAKMKHSIGETNIKLGFFRLFIHSPNRSYYKLRNPFLLLNKKSIPNILAFKEIIAALFHHFILLFFVKSKMAYTKSYWKATIDGIKRKTGKIKL